MVQGCKIKEHKNTKKEADWNRDGKEIVLKKRMRGGEEIMPPRKNYWFPVRPCGDLFR